MNTLFFFFLMNTLKAKSLHTFLIIFPGWIPKMEQLPSSFWDPLTNKLGRKYFLCLCFICLILSLFLLIKEICSHPKFSLNAEICIKKDLRFPWILQSRDNAINHLVYIRSTSYDGLPRWCSSKESVCNAGDAGDAGSIPKMGRYSGEGNGNPLQYSCLENPMDRGAWWVTVHEVAKNQTRLSMHTYTRVHAHTHTQHQVVGLNG